MSEMEMEVQRSLGRVEEGIRSLQAQMTDLVSTQKSDMTKLVDRVSKLERFRSYMLGYVAGSVAIIAALFAIVWRVLPSLTG